MRKAVVLALVLLLHVGTASAQSWTLFSGTMTRVTFTGGTRAESKWQLELRVPASSGTPTTGKRSSTIVLKHAGKTDTYEMKSAYVTSSMAVYLAKRGSSSITLIVPQVPKAQPGSSAPARGVILFDDDLVSTFIDGTWAVETIKQRQ